MFNQSDLWGIPKFNEWGEITAIIFYENYNDYIPLNEILFSELISNAASFTFDREVEITNAHTQSNPQINGTIYIPQDSYPVYPLENMEGIYVITLEVTE